MAAGPASRCRGCRRVRRLDDHVALLGPAATGGRRPGVAPSLRYFGPSRGLHPDAPGTCSAPPPCARCLRCGPRRRARARRPQEGDLGPATRDGVSQFPIYQDLGLRSTRSVCPGRGSRPAARPIRQTPTTRLPVAGRPRPGRRRRRLDGRARLDRARPPRRGGPTAATRASSPRSTPATSPPSPRPRPSATRACTCGGCRPRPPRGDLQAARPRAPRPAADDSHEARPRRYAAIARHLRRAEGVAGKPVIGREPHHQRHLGLDWIDNLNRRAASRRAWTCRARPVTSRMPSFKARRWATGSPTTPTSTCSPAGSTGPPAGRARPRAQAVPCRVLGPDRPRQRRVQLLREQPSGPSGRRRPTGWPTLVADLRAGWVSLDDDDPRADGTAGPPRLLTATGERSRVLRCTTADSKKNPVLPNRGSVPRIAAVTLAVVSLAALAATSASADTPPPPNGRRAISSVWSPMTRSPRRATTATSSRDPGVARGTAAAPDLQLVADRGRARPVRPQLLRRVRRRRRARRISILPILSRSALPGPKIGDHRLSA